MRHAVHVLVGMHHANPVSIPLILSRNPICKLQPGLPQSGERAREKAHRPWAQTAQSVVVGVTSPLLDRLHTTRTSGPLKHGGYLTSSRLCSLHSPDTHLNADHYSKLQHNA